MRELSFAELESVSGGDYDVICTTECNSPTDCKMKCVIVQIGG